MKRLYKFLMSMVMAMALTVPWTTQAQLTLTVADGTTTNSYVPVYGLYMDDYNRSQFVYPATLLPDFSSGVTINGMTFYTSSNPSPWTSNMSVKLMEVDFATFSSTTFIGSDTATVVYTGTLNASTGTMTINFDVPYSYNGGNLLVEFVSNTSGNYSSASWLGISSNGSSIMGYSSSGVSGISASQRNFLPKVTFDYAPSGDFCMPPTGLTYSDVASDGFTINWVGNSDANGYVVKLGEDEYYSSDTTYTFTNLDLNTVYTVYVASLCTDTSVWRSISVRTLAGDPISEFPYTCGFEINDDEENEAAAWVLETGTSNGWYVGTAAKNTGSRGLYISNDNGTSNAYTNSVSGVAYAYATFQLTPGEYAFSFDWLANGESSWDFLRAAIAPYGTAMPFGYSSWSSSAIAPGFTTLDGGYLNLQTTWQTKTGTFNIDSAGVYNFYFVWRNDGSGGTNPPAAVDNFTLVRNLCPAPTNFTVNASGDTATFAWTDANGTQWDLIYVSQGMTPNEDDAISVSATSYEATDLATGFYDAYVRSNCGNDQSFWVGPVGFSVGVDVVNMATTGTNTLNTCAAIIYDNGGATGEYANSCNSTLTIYPNQTGTVLSVSGSASTESSWDYLYIYEGVGTNGNQLLYNSGVFDIGPFMVDGPITIVFTSDASGTRDGFQINVSCIVPPDCQRPETFHLLSLLPESAEFSWTDNSNTSWGIEYGPAGFTRGDENDTSIHWALFTDTTGWVTGLTPSVNYDFYLVALCTDTSWARQITARTPCNAIPDTSLPYHYGFEGTSIDACWRLFNIGNSTVYPSISTSYRAEGSKSLYFYGYSNSYCSYAVMPMFETPLNQLMMEFKLYKTSDSYGSIEVGVMTNPSDLSTFQTIGIYQAQVLSTWENFRVNFGTYNGNGRYIAFLQRSTYGTYLDDVNVYVRPSCPNPVNVTVQAVSASSAYVTWDYASGYEVAPDGYRLTVTDTANNATVIPGIAVTNYTLTGLTPGQDYVVSVEAECDGAYGEHATAAFRTNGLECLVLDSTTVAQVTDTIGNFSGSTTTSYFPTYTFYNYAASQVIYKAEEIGHAGTISAFDFKMNSVSTPTRTVKIYMGHTSSANASSWITSNLTQVYNGPAITLTTGWNTYTLTTPFDYNGTDNLVIVCIDETGTYSSSNSASATTTSTSLFRYYYRDATPAISLTELATSSNGSTSTTRPNIVLHSTGYGCAQADSCVGPLVTVTDLGATSLNLLWAPGFRDTAWTVEHKAVGDSVWTVDLTNTTTTSFAYTNLQASTKYMFRVSHACGDTTKATVYTVTTDCLPAAVPFSENFATWMVGSGSAVPTPACWYRVTSYTSAMYPYVSESYSMSGGKSMYMYSTNSTYSYLALPKMDAPMDTLMVSFYLMKTNTSYSHAVNVGVLTDPEDVSTFYQVGTATPSQLNTWQGFEFSMAGAPEGRITIMSPTGVYCYPYLDNIEVNYYNPCVRPVNVHSTVVTTDSATISWTDTATTNFEVEYGPAGFAHGTGTVISVTGNSTILAGLAHSTRYDVYVRGVCGTDNYSEWSFVHTFATQCSPIDVLPFTENFNNWGTGHLPNCWSNTASYSPSSYGIISTGSINHGTGSGHAVYMYQSYTAPNKSLVVLPPLDTTLFQASATQVVFHLTYTSSSYSVPKLVVGVMDNPTDTSTFVPVDTVTHSGTLNQWDVFEVALNSYTGTGAYVALRTVLGSTSSDYSYFYIDDLTLELIPSCLRPDSLTADNATVNSIELGWRERGTANSWIIEYGPRGFQLGTGTVVNATTNPFTLTGLPAAYEGEFYVRSICGAGDTGAYSRVPYGFNTQQIPATLPYNYNFEDPAEWNNWQTSSNHAVNNWYRGSAVADSGSYSMYITADSGATYKPYYYDSRVNAAAYRDIDFGPIDSSYTLTFRARAGGTLTAAYDALMVFLVDPSVPTTPSDQNITTPWGSVNDLYRIASVRLDTTWQTYEASFDTIHGVHRVAFFWFNQNTGSSNTNLPEPAAVDNISIKYSSCPRPLNLDAVPGTTTALVTWTGDPNGTYEITYRKTGDTVNSTLVVNTNQHNFTNLSSPAEYRMWVRKLCGAGDTSLYSDGVRFRTICAPVTVFPWVEDFEVADNFECWDQQGDSEWELDAGDANISTAHSGSQNAVITHSDNGDVTMLISPVLALGGGNATLTFWHTQHTWAGDQDSLKVYYRTSQSDTWHLLTTYTEDIATWRLDTVVLPNTTSTYQIGFEFYDGYGYGVGIDSIVVTGSAAAACESPVITDLTATETTATVQFTAPDIVEVAIAETWTDNMTGTTTSASSYTFTGLTANTTYTIGVRTLCATDEVSEWTTQTITTDAHPCYAPTDLTITNVTLNGGTVIWTVGEQGQNAFEVNVHNSTYDSTYTVNDATTLTLTGLYSETDYEVKVRAVCGGNGNVSDWSDTVVLTPSSCAMPTGVTSSNVTATSAKISWAGNAASYEVRYGVDITTAGGQVVTVTTNEAVLTGLDEETQYDVYVRAVCDGATSNWTAKYQFTTTAGGEGINDVVGSDVVLYPNPASTQVTLAGLETGAMVTVVDLNGRRCGQWKTTAESMTIDLTGYAQGAYFVRIVGEQGTVVRKLIVK